MKNRLVSWVGITGLVIAAGLSAGCRDKQTESPAPYEYDAERNQYWHPGHGHWHPGRPPER